MKKTRWVAATLVAAAPLLFMPFSPSGHASFIQAEALQDNQSQTNASIPKVEDGVKTPEPQSRLYPVQVNGKWGYIDRTGDWMIEPRFDMAEDFSGGLARVKVDDGAYAYVDRRGNWVWKPSK